MKSFLKLFSSKEKLVLLVVKMDIVFISLLHCLQCYLEISLAIRSLFIARINPVTKTVLADIFEYCNTVPIIVF